jgi:hypothetical protein
MKTIPLFLTGMFRSGTTTMAHALDAHPEIAFASDPFLEFFKTLRSDLAREKQGRDIPYRAPLDDYYFSEDGISLLREIEGASYLREWGHVPWQDLVPIFKTRCQTYSGLLEKYIDSISGNTYAELLSSLLDNIGACYSEGKEVKVTGFKEVWATEFVPSFLDNLPGSKVIIMVRDPRAVCASKNVAEEKYPWIFLVRQWRKLAAIGWAYANNPKYADRIYLLSYEGLVHEPERVTKEISAFLGIAWHPDFADPSSYKGGDGSRWTQNTSYGTGEQKFDTSSLDKWKKKLTEEEISFIDYYCGPEMELFGYKPASQAKGSQSCIAAPRISDAEQAVWMKGLISNDLEHLAVELAKENLRSELLSLPREKAVDEEYARLIDLAFLHRSLYFAILDRKSASGGSV